MSAIATVVGAVVADVTDVLWLADCGADAPAFELFPVEAVGCTGVCEPLLFDSGDVAGVVATGSDGVTTGSAAAGVSGSAGASVAGSDGRQQRQVRH